MLLDLLRARLGLRFRLLLRFRRRGRAAADSSPRVVARLLVGQLLHDRLVVLLLLDRLIDLVLGRVFRVRRRDIHLRTDRRRQSQQYGRAQESGSHGDPPRAVRVAVQAVLAAEFNALPQLRKARPAGVSLIAAALDWLWPFGPDRRIFEHGKNQITARYLQNGTAQGRRLANSGALPRV